MGVSTRHKLVTLHVIESVLFESRGCLLVRDYLRSSGQQHSDSRHKRPIRSPQQFSSS
jgi:hypothetical protein